MPPVEIHGYAHCPFAWRTRITAAEKGVAFEYVAIDGEPLDPRVAHNPERRSPLFVDGDVRLTESMVIVHYIDEAYPGRALQPTAARERAEMRLAMAQIGGRLEFNTAAGAVLDEVTHKKIAAGLAALEERLGSGALYLGGETPSIADAMVWPFLAALEKRQSMNVGADRPRAFAYWTRVKARPTYLETRPPWAR